MRDERQTGAFGAPPPDAPHENIQPLSPDLVAQQLARAQQNERTLAPFDPPAYVTPVPAPAQPREQSPAGNLNAAAKALSDARAARQDGSHQPAASDSDSPARGVPKPILDAGKAITGGFGSVGEAQYYPITGLELQEIVKGMVDSFLARIENDLRFSMAITYPRLVCELELRFSGWAQDKTETVKVVKTHELTPMEVAKDYGAEVVFVVREEKSEFNTAGEAVDPPDRMRHAAGLPVPSKRLVDAGAIRVLVDTVPLPEETF